MSIVWNDDACVIYFGNEESLSKSKHLLNQESEEFDEKNITNAQTQKL